MAWIVLPSFRAHNVICNMQILHKGKILYPNTQQTPLTISSNLLDVCEKGGKPLVMGTRLTAREQKLATVKWCYTLLYRLVESIIARAIGVLRGLLSPIAPAGGAGGTTAIEPRPHRD